MPCIVYTPNWRNTLEGEWMPSRFFAPWIASPTAPFTLSTRRPAAPVTPLMRPWMMLLPIWPSVPGMDARPSRRLEPNCDAAAVALVAKLPTQPATVEITPVSHDSTLPGSPDRNEPMPCTNWLPACVAFVHMAAAQFTTLWMAHDRYPPISSGSCAKNAPTWSTNAWTLAGASTMALTNPVTPSMIARTTPTMTVNVSTSRMPAATSTLPSTSASGCTQTWASTNASPSMPSCPPRFSSAGIRYSPACAETPSRKPPNSCRAVDTTSTAPAKSKSPASSESPSPARCANACTSPRNCSMPVSSQFGSGSSNLSVMNVPAMSNASNRASPNAPPTCAAISGPCVTTVPTNVPTICPTRGPTLSTTWPIDSSSCPLSSCMSAVSEPRPVTQLAHAAFAMLMEPSMVCAASLAVVPMMPCFSWIRSMAVTMSEKLSIERSLARPVAAAYSFASAMRRSISDFVPP